MCGITGFLSRPSEIGPEPRACVTAMTRTLIHRGPDSEGIWADASAGIALGHRRLSILDLSSSGSQPMVSANGRFVIVFNGEIYNFLHLRKLLETESGAALQFQGHSDTEVMLACFERWGVCNSVSRFNGMFAFAVWDRLERRLYLARDPLGEKPLYYGWSGSTFLFGSELKALRAYPVFKAEIDRNVLPLFLKYGYVPAPYSIYKNVYKLPPATILTITAGSVSPEMTCYWSFKDIAEQGCERPFEGSSEEAERQLEALLADATQLRMIADVQVGAFLSGGIDSSLVVALMQSQSSKSVKTFTIGFHERDYNEAEAAKAIAKHLHTDHTECYVTPAEVMAVIPRLPTLYDEPFGDSSQIPTFLVSALARKDVTVSLSGDGGDELFGGYNNYERTSRVRRSLNSIPVSLRTLLASALKPITGVKPSRFVSAGLSLMPDSIDVHKLRRLAAIAPLTDPAELYTAFHSQWHNPTALVLGTEDTLSPDHGQWPRCPDFMHQMMSMDTVRYLPDDILVKVDRASMGVSLESRIPILDRRVVEFAWTLPLAMKLRDGQGKWILRQILYKHVPRSLVDRPKTGFVIPVGQWLRGPLRAWAEELLDAKRLQREGYFASEPIRRRWAEHLSGKPNHTGPLWSVLMFQAWFERVSLGSSLPDLASELKDSEAVAH
jgi:asparagine synthase (glutamine-hydrolysing)